VAAPEPRECATLFNNSRGAHRIEGIGDKMVTLIHNVLTTDYVVLVHDDDCIRGLELLEQRQPLVEKILRLPEGSLRPFRGLFGISSICNIIASIRMARHLHLGPEDNVVTIATDGFDRYPSVLADLARREALLEDTKLRGWFAAIFRGADPQEILDVRPREQKERLFRYKEETWTRFHYSRAYLEQMKSQAFWDAEAAKIAEIDSALFRAREL
jgi:hypothetical protein